MKWAFVFYLIVVEDVGRCPRVPWFPWSPVSLCEVVWPVGVWPTGCRSVESLLSEDEGCGCSDCSPGPLPLQGCGLHLQSPLPPHGEAGGAASAGTSVRDEGRQERRHWGGEGEPQSPGHSQPQLCRQPGYLQRCGTGQCCNVSLIRGYKLPWISW